MAPLICENEVISSPHLVRDLHPLAAGMFSARFRRTSSAKANTNNGFGPVEGRGIAWFLQV
ncbi:hypothetical protein BDV23DRAFT_181693 [Aspergillus alliaceus]|uniref:Uncharacterized protein n=1 Tax=Petromyces alliaceus TaxID=209559 RepID=A0A5N7CDV4_PETAA|nr:hypothetical protein BDV23DRAFT_181693 [Aspergillus alliaceus]